jgi:hypothetical protein
VGQESIQLVSTNPKEGLQEVQKLNLFSQVLQEDEHSKQVEFYKNIPSKQEVQFENVISQDLQITEQD